MKVPILFLKAFVYTIGIIVLVLCFWLPILAEKAATMNPEYAYLQYPVLIGIYLTAIPYYFALYQALKLLNYIQSEMAFSDLAVTSLKQIKRCAISILILYAVGMLLLAIQNALHPGIAILGLIIVFATAVIQFFSSIFQNQLKNAQRIKLENELTI